jgi:hypothetical protein
LVWVSSSSPLLRVADQAVLQCAEGDGAARGEGCRGWSVVEVDGEGIDGVRKLLGLQ